MAYTINDLRNVIKQNKGNLNSSSVTNVLSTITNLSSLFSSSDFSNWTNENFNGIGNWDVSHVTSMRSVFNGCVNFNQNISNWNVSNVTDMSYMFQNCISFNQDLDSWTPNITSSAYKSQVFYSNKGDMIQTSAYWYNGIYHPIDKNKLKSYINNLAIPLSSISINGVLDLSYLFDGSRRTDISSLFVNGRLTIKRPVLDVSYMFRNCTNFSDTSSRSWLDVYLNDATINAKGMFEGCTALNKQIRMYKPSSISSGTNDALVDCSYMFSGCISLPKCCTFSNIRISKMDYMYKNCTSLTETVGTNDYYGIYTNNWYTTMTYMFQGCTSLRTAYLFIKLKDNLSSYNNTPLNFQGMFDGCTSLTTVTIGFATFSSDYIYYPIGNISYMFNGCVNLVNFSSGSFERKNLLHEMDFSALTTCSYAFYNCNKWEYCLDRMNVPSSANKTNCFTGEVKAFWYDGYYYPSDLSWDLNFAIFDRIRNNQPIDKIRWYVKKTLNKLFNSITSTSDGSFNGINTWDVSKVTDMSYLFYNCINFNQSISNWNVSNVTNMSYMFSGCSNFNQSISNWNVSNVTNMSYMFQNCINFNQSISSLNVSNVTDMRGLFSGCINFNQDLSSWSSKLNSVKYIDYMFYNCSSYSYNLNSWDATIFWDNRGSKSTTFYNCSKYPYWMETPSIKVYLGKSKTIEYNDIYPSNINSSLTFENTPTTTQMNITKNNYHNYTYTPNQEFTTKTIARIDGGKAFIPISGALPSVATRINTRAQIRTDYDFDTNFPELDLSSLSIVSDTADLIVEHIRDHIYAFTAINAGTFTATADILGYTSKITVVASHYLSSDSITITQCETFEKRYNSIYPDINLNDFSIVSNDINLSISKNSNNTFNFYSEYTGTFSATAIYKNEQLKFNIIVNKLIQEESIDCYNSKPYTINFNEKYPNADLTNLSLYQLNSNTINVKNIDVGIFEITTIGVGDFVLVASIFNTNTNISLNSQSVLTDIEINTTSNIKSDFDLSKKLNNIDPSNLEVLSNDSELSINKKTNNKFEIYTTRSGSYTANINLNNESSILTINTNKLIEDEELNIKTNSYYTTDYSLLYPNSVLDNFSIISNDPELIIQEISTNTYKVNSDLLGTYTATVNLNGDISTFTYNVSSLLEDKIIFVRNKAYNLNFNKLFPNSEISNIEISSLSNSNVIINKIGDANFRILFLEKGSYKILVKVGELECFYTFKVFYIDTTDPDIYYYKDTFIDELIKPILYEPNLFIYQYNQYGEIEWINKFFNYMNDKMKKYLDYIYLWFVLKTNQQLIKSDISDINDENYYFYINFVEKYFKGLNKAFGSSSAITFWDNEENKWNDNKTRWDETIKSSDLSINKLKSILRYISDISNKNFNLIRFIDFCNDFVNCDNINDDEKIELFIDDTSFETPEDIIIYATDTNENVNVFLSILTTSYKYIMPMYNFSIRKK